MNRLLIYGLSLAIVLFSFFACTKEYSQENNQLPGISNNGTGGCKSCTHIPWCDQSYYAYVDSTSLGVDTTEYYYEFLGDTTINGLVFTKTNDGAGYTVYHNCQNNTTTILSPDFGNTLFAHTLLNAKLLVGNVWIDSFPGNPFYNKTKYKILSKSTTRTVRGNLFVDVIRVQEDDFLDSTLLTSSNVFYARGIGEIEKITVDTSGQQLLHRVILEHQIP